MSTKEKLVALLREAILTKNELNKRTIRMILTSIKLAEVEVKHALSESEILSILYKEIKIREETIFDAEKADRVDLADAAKQEKHLLTAMLPQQLSDEELKKAVERAIMELQATSISDMGKVMKVLLPQVQGRAKNERISEFVRNSLNAKSIP
jgi:uncharacterized protein